MSSDEAITEFGYAHYHNDARHVSYGLGNKERTINDYVRARYLFASPEFSDIFTEDGRRRRHLRQVRLVMEQMIMTSEYRHMPPGIVRIAHGYSLVQWWSSRKNAYTAAHKAAEKWSARYIQEFQDSFGECRVMKQHRRQRGEI